MQTKLTLVNSLSTLPLTSFCPKQLIRFFLMSAWVLYVYQDTNIAVIKNSRFRPPYMLGPKLACIDKTFMESYIKDTKRQGSLLQLLRRALAEGFFPLQAIKRLIMLFLPIVCHIWCLVLTLVTLGSNLNHFL